MTRLLMIMEMNLRDLIRRRAVLGLLFALPLVFYLGRRSDSTYTGQAIRFLLLGLGFTISTASLFAVVAARSMDHRLRLSGYRVIHLYLGRLAALLVVGSAIAIPYLALVAFDQKVERLGAVALAMVLTVLVGAPLGMLLGAVVPRELEGALLLLALIALQFLMDPAKSSARLMPFWSAREIGTYAIDMTDVGYLHRGLVHASICAIAATAITATITTVRLRDRRPALPRP